MAEESARTKALSDFLVASPHDFDRKWAEYVALAPDLAGFLDLKRGQAMESSSSASPATQSTASLRVLRNTAPTNESSLKRDSTRDDLSPGARHLYDLLVGGSASPTPAASLRAPRSASSIGGIPGSAAATAAPEVNLQSVTPSTCSTDLAPESEAIYQLLMADQSVYEEQFAEYAEKYGTSSCCRSGDLPPRAPASVADHTAVVVHSTSAASSKGVLSARPFTTAPTAPATALKVAPVAVDINTTDLGNMVPTSCSSECPSHKAAVPLSVVISSATPNSPTTTWGVLPELATPAVSDKALDMDLVGDNSRADTICLPADLDDSTSEEEVSLDVSLTLGNALASFVPSQLFEAMAPGSCLICCSTESVGKFNRALRPWPSFECNQFWTSLVRLSRGLQRLRPPWPPPELDIPGWHMKEAAKSLAHRLESVERIMLHPVHKRVSSHSPIADNEMSSPCVKSFLDDVLWKRPKWWSNIQCIRPTNSIPDMFPWLWITGKHAGVQLQFSYPLFPVTCHFVRVHFLLYRRAQVNVESNSGTSLNLIVYCGYPALNIAHAHYWMWIIVGHLQYCLEEADALLLLISWLYELYLQLFLGQPCAVQLFTSSSVVRKYLSSNIFLAILNGKAEVQQRCSCPRVLTAVVCKGWIHCLILQGITQYSELRSWSISATLLQSGFGFHATEDIDHFFCCALLHWTNTWTSNRVSLEFWFQYCSAGRESLHGCENFQWTISWLLSYHLPLPTLQTHKIYSARLSSWKDAMLVVNQWILVRCAIYVWNSVLMELVLDGDNILCLADHFIQRDSELMLWIFSCFFSCPLLGKRLSVFAAGSDVPTFMILRFPSNSKIELKPWSSWELFSCIAIVSRCLVGALHILVSSVFFLKGIYSIFTHYLEVHSLGENFAKLITMTVLHAGELYCLLGLYSSCNQCVTEDATYFGCQHFEWQNPCVPDIKYNSGMFSLALRHLEDGNYFAAAVLLLDNQLSPGWVFSLHVACVMQCRSQLMLWEITRSKDDSLTCITQLLLSWDPGGSTPFIAATTDSTWNGTQLQFSYMTWDPGGHTQHRLEGKPIFKEGGLSATFPVAHSWARQWAATIGLGLTDYIKATTTNTRSRGIDNSA